MHVFAKLFHNVKHKKAKNGVKTVYKEGVRKGMNISCTRKALAVFDKIISMYKEGFGSF